MRTLTRASRQRITQGPHPASSIQLAARIGFWAGIWAAAAAVAYPLAVVVGSLLFPQAEWTGDAASFPQ